MYRALFQKFALPVMIFASVTSFFADYSMAQPGLIYGVRDLGNRFIVRSLDLTDQGFTADLLTGNQPAKERIRDMFLLPDGRLALLRTNVVRNAKANRANIEILGNPVEGLHQSPSDTIKIKELPSEHAASAAMPSSKGSNQSLTALFSHFSDTPPFSVGTIDLATGQTTTLPFQVPAQVRFSNLTQCPDGVAYAISLGTQEGGGAHLVRMEFELGRFVELAQLHLEGNTLHDDLKSLSCSTSGEIFALGDPTYRGVNSLFSVDPSTGDLIFIQTFDVDLITVSVPTGL